MGCKHLSCRLQAHSCSLFPNGHVLWDVNTVIAVTGQELFTGPLLSG